MTYFVFLLALVLTSCTEHYPGSDEAYEAIHAYGEKAAENHDWALYGIGGSFYDRVRKLNLDFLLYKEASRTEARRMIVMGVEELLQDVNNNKKLTPHLIQYPFTYNNLDFGISFTDPTTGGHFNNDTIAYVFLLNGKIHYSLVGEDHFTKERFEEPYPEAYKIVMGHDLPHSPPQEN